MLRGAPTTSQARARRAQEARFLAPTAGWVANRNLANPATLQQGQGAEILDNWFPTSRTVLMRRGSLTYAVLGNGAQAAASMFKYVVGNTRKLFAATASTVYDITSVPPGGATTGFEVLSNTGGGQWSTVQFATSGGVFLIGVNGAGQGFIYDGTAFKALQGDPDPLYPGITFPNGSGLTAADLSYVWAYKNRLFFVQKNNFNVWYLAIDQIGGALTQFRMGSEFGRGGSLMFGQSWSLSSGAEGGLSEQCIFVSTEGEVVVFQGVNPSEATSWSKVGTYRIGRPLGTKAMIRAGGDIVIATSVGFVALSKAIEVAYAALAPSAISYAIEEAWTDAVQTRSSGMWQCILWDDQQMAIVAPAPSITEKSIFVSNSGTAAWARFTGWNVTCLEVFNGRLFFGTEDGRVKEAMVSGNDDGMPYTGAYVPLFSDEGTPTSLKTARLARAALRGSVNMNERVTCRFDFDTMLPPVPNASQIGTDNQWDNGIWNQSVWDGDRASVRTHTRQSVSGAGYRLAPSLQITSGAVVPLDAEIISIEVTYDVGGSFL